MISRILQPSILRQLFISFIGFGLIVAIVFPFYAEYFVTWKPGMYNWFVAGCVVAGISMGIANYFLVKLILLKKMYRMADLISAISEKDVSQTCGLVSNDMLGDISNGMNQMTDNLRHIIQHINNDAEELSNASEQMCSVMDSNSDELKHQLTQVEEVSNSMNQIEASAQQVANHADESAKATVHADKQAEKVQLAMVNVMCAVDSLADMIGDASGVIHKLESESANISNLLSVISSIADQTNLLALNAAIEAARAGEHGRGFAVVADEVRKLATNTQQSTEEISTMFDRLQSETRDAVSVMEQGRKQANEGVELTETAVELLSEISGSMGTLKQMSQQIANTSSEQSNVIKVINHNMVAINDVSMQTSQSMQNATNTSQTISRHATELKNMVADFKT